MRFLVRLSLLPQVCHFQFGWSLPGIPGAISLVDARDVKRGMKMIKVEGLFPGEAGYPQD